MTHTRESRLIFRLGDINRPMRNNLPENGTEGPEVKGKTPSKEPHVDQRHETPEELRIKVEELSRRLAKIKESVPQNLCASFFCREILPRLDIGIEGNQPYFIINFSDRKEFFNNPYFPVFETVMKIEDEKMGWKREIHGTTMRRYMTFDQISNVVSNTEDMLASGDLKETKKEEKIRDDRYGVSHVDRLPIATEYRNAHPTPILQESQSGTREDYGTGETKNDNAPGTPVRARIVPANELMRDRLERCPKDFHETAIGRVLSNGAFMESPDGHRFFVIPKEHGIALRRVLFLFSDRPSLFPRIEKDPDGQYGIECTPEGIERIIDHTAIFTPEGPPVDWNSRFMKELIRRLPEVDGEYLKQAGITQNSEMVRETMGGQP